MSSVHLFADEDDELVVRRPSGGRSYEVRIGRDVYLTLRAEVAERLHAALAAAQEQGGAS